MYVISLLYLKGVGSSGPYRRRACTPKISSGPNRGTLYVIYIVYDIIANLYIITRLSLLIFILSISY